MSLDDLARTINSREDLVLFLRALKQDFETNPNAWENINISSYLDAIAAWIEDMDGLYRNQGEEIPTYPTWKLIGAILFAAKFYE